MSHPKPLVSQPRKWYFHSYCQQLYQYYQSAGTISTHQSLLNSRVTFSAASLPSVPLAPTAGSLLREFFLLCSTSFSQSTATSRGWKSFYCHWKDAMGWTVSSCDCIVTGLPIHWYAKYQAESHCALWGNELAGLWFVWWPESHLVGGGPPMLLWSKLQTGGRGTETWILMFRIIKEWMCVAWSHHVVMICHRATWNKNTLGQGTQGTVCSLHKVKCK